MIEHQYLTYRGRIRAFQSSATGAIFVTQHPEGQATALYRLDSTQAQLQFSTDALPCGATALVANDKTVWLAGTDGKLYSANRDKGKPKAIEGIQFEAVERKQVEVLSLQLLANERLAILLATQLHVLNLQNQAIEQTLELEDAATVMVVSPDGLWVSVGASNGVVAVYQWLETQLVFSAKATLHKGAVSALCFETNELRFYSAGLDKQLLSTHAQGKLEALDKGRNSNHTSTIRSIIVGKERFFTGADDKSIKSWSYSGGQPVTAKQNLPKITAMGFIHWQGQPHILVSGTDQTLRLVSLTADERPTDVVLVAHDGYDNAENQLKLPDAKDREGAIELLAQYDDQDALQLLEKHLVNEQDKTLREDMVKRLIKFKHPKANLALEACLSDKRHDSVRRLAFNGLVERYKTQADPLYPLFKGLETPFQDIALLALKALAPYAATNPRAEQAIAQALNHSEKAVRQQALQSLETLYAQDNPKADLQALQSSYADVQRAALIRLYQRELLASFEVQRALVRQQESADDAVRHTAWLISVLSRPKLAEVLKARDKDLARQLLQLQQFDLAVLDNDKPLEIKDKATKAQQDTKQLKPDDYTPLLQGMSSRYADICFNSAYALAVLQDTRAVGLLLILAQNRTQTIRVGVARALGWLQVAQSRQTLEVLLNDTEAAVRDAAFTALGALELTPLALAAIGFNARANDVHDRALKLLLDTIPAAAKMQPEALSLLQQALNDPYESIRRETFKACLNRSLGGDTAGTLRLLLTSRYEDVHQEVLKELMAQAKAEWVPALLLELLSDPFAGLRAQALEFALKEKKRFDSETVLLAAAKTPFVDMRRAALQRSLAKPLTKQSDLLQLLIDDTDQTLRQDALAAIIDSQDASALSRALQSPYEDIQVSAARAGARLGDSSAYRLLEQFATRPQPLASDKTATEAWINRTTNALTGLAELGDTRAFDIVIAALKSTQSPIMSSAAAALPWVSDSHHIASLVELIKHNSPLVVANAGLALALLGDERGQAVLKDNKFAAQISAHEDLAAQLALNAATPLNLQNLIINSNASLTSQFALVSYELWQHPDAPYLSSWALALPYPPLQLVCAELLTRYNDKDAQWAFMQTWLQQAQTEHDEAWRIEVNTLKQIGGLLVFAPNKLKAQLVLLLSAWDQKLELKQWQWRWKAFNERYKAEISRVRLPAVDGDKVDLAACQTQAFGAFLGLARLDNEPISASAALNIRRQAVVSLCALAKNHASWWDSVVQSLLPLLNHPQQLVRQHVFDSLKTLGVTPEVLGKAALSSSAQDTATQGLALLVNSLGKKEAQPLLQELIQASDPILSTEAFKTLSADIGLLKAAPFALQSYYLPLRYSAVQQLAEKAVSDKAAAELLVQATTNDDRSSAIAAAQVLLRQQHSAAVPALKRLLTHSQDAYEQAQLVTSLRTIEGEHVPEFLLEYLATNPLLRLETSEVYAAIASSRAPRMATPLLARLSTQRKEVKSIVDAVLTISGYDQAIEDFEDERSDQNWLSKQYARHDEVLVKLLQALVTNHDYKYLSNLTQSLQWAKPNAELDQALLSAMAVVPIEQLPVMVEIIGRRFYKRNGLVDGVLQALTHKDVTIQFLAAEALAKGGRKEGLSVLLAAVDYQTNDEYRKRAVLALGEVGDERALDKLLTLAQEAGHFLQETATEALGHMGKSDKADTIFRLLKKALDEASTYSDMNKRALNGLRWFNTLPAWQVISEYSREGDYDEWRRHALELLQYWDTPTSRTRLLEAIRQDDDADCVVAAYHAARRLTKVSDTEASDIDFAVLQGYYPLLDESKPLDRVAKYASAEHIMQLLLGNLESDEAQEQVIQPLSASLMQKELPDANIITASLQAERAELVTLMAQRLAREPKLDKAVTQALQAALSYHYQAFTEYQRLLDQGSQSVPDLDTKYQQSMSALTALTWLVVVQAVPNDVIPALLGQRHKALMGLQQGILTALLVAKTAEKDVVQAVYELQQSELVTLYPLATQVLALHPLPKSALQGLTERLSHFWKTTPEAVIGFAQLPDLIKQGDWKTLQQVAQDTKADEELRIAAIESLAVLPNSEVEAILQNLTQQGGDEDINKAAYRALRRRQRAKTKTTPASQGAAV